MAVVVVVMSSAERFERSIGILMSRNADRWSLIQEEMDY
jgi:hypothetical protein